LSHLALPSSAVGDSKSFKAFGSADNETCWGGVVHGIFENRHHHPTLK